MYHAGLAQLVEHRYRKPRVTGSSPAAGITVCYVLLWDGAMIPSATSLADSAKSEDVINANLEKRSNGAAIQIVLTIFD